MKGRKAAWRSGAVLCLGALLAGCAMLPKERISSSTTDYNLVVEKVQNEMLLLNIVRASKRHPMYFTGFNLLRGSMSYGFQTGDLTIPFGRIGAGLDGAYSIAPSVSYSTNPSFDLMVWDNKEFTTGIMTPVSMDAVYYYLEVLGWPKEMLLHLLVERIELYSNDTLSATYRNDPGKGKLFEEFQGKLHELLQCRLQTRERYEPIGPRLQAREVSDLEQLVQAHKAGLVLRSGTEGGSEWYQLTSKKIDYALSCAADRASGATVYGIASGAPSGPPPQAERNYYRFILRSPEGILYYLGEILRSETESGNIPMIEVCESRPPVPLFLVKKENPEGRAAVVTVDYGEQKYFIPGNTAVGPDSDCSGDRSMHVLTFVAQLIAEQKAGINAPVTGAVTTVGR